MKKIIVGFVVIALAIVLGGQTLQPTGGGGGSGPNCSTANGVMFNSGSLITCDNGLTYTGNAAAPSKFIIGNVTTGHGNEFDLYGSSSAGNRSIYITDNGTVTMSLASSGILGFSSTADAAFIDTGFSRASAGVLNFGSGTAGDVTGTLKGRSYISASTAPATTGSCSFGSFVGGSTAGTFVAQGCGQPATAATAMVLLLPATAPNGWSCDATDRTTQAVTPMVQVASTVSAVNFKAVTATGDVIQWKCIGY